ncbi:hypothetical protein AVEN_180579-1 [Araneus ventricosus]|uniref:Uncharacterized protein n=1 Tax=Araneus ventricosus TaxID=182803 RepID=A0A4Y2V219_ARAVE|nr:hypothetical protein AVEN_180579-1 [Araneus ventricosus]
MEPLSSGKVLPGQVNPDFSLIISSAGSEFVGWLENSYSTNSTAGAIQATGGLAMFFTHSFNTQKSQVMWGMFTWSALRPVVLVDNTMKPVGNMDVIAGKFHSSMIHLFS